MWLDPVRRIQFLEYFRSLDDALSEHKQKGTARGDPVFLKIFDQLAGDLFTIGIGRDDIPAFAQEYGQLSTYKRLEQLMTRQHQPQESAAIELLNDQLNKLMGVRSLNFKDPQFITWRSTVTDLFQGFLRPDSPHLITFRDLRFRGRVQARRLPFNYRGPLPSETVSPEDVVKFQSDCAIAEGCIRGAMDTIQNFGIYSEEPREKATMSGGVQQNFHGPVTIQTQAIATDNAIQSIEHIGDEGTSLKEIAALLQESMELRGREVQDGLKAVEGIASEIQKPQEGRNWKSVLDYGEKLLDIAGKATDLTAKLTPHLPMIAQLVHQAKTTLGF